jgi:putative chitinase
MGIEQRIIGQLPSPGPYIGRITNLKDTTFMGSIEVVIEKGSPVGSSLIETQTYPVRYLSPFYGATAPQFEGTDPRKFDDVQKSYGMWMIPPDIGTKVLVIFIDGDPNQGYWLGCIQHEFQNHMVPGIAASVDGSDVYLTPEQELKYGTKRLPVAEFHKRSVKTFLDPISQKKPVHPFADRLLAQGLLLDDIRGTTSSSARREAPSRVFGISTPGPLDPNSSNKQALGYASNKGDSVSVSRLGGTTFVMDDGDKNGQNELVRIRTRTGHQILMHNSSDLIYIANSKGTAWIELTSNGKIDVYAKDSVSIHTEFDFNFRADRDINIEAGRNINMNAFSGIEMNSIDRFNVICNKDGKLVFGGNANLLANSNIKFQAGATANISSEAALRISSGASINVGASGNIIQSATEIHQNGPAAEAADSPDDATKLEIFSLPYRSDSSGWANGQFYKSGNIDSIMQRVPTHEPWDHHENTNPNKFISANTDVQVTARTDGPSSPTATAGSLPINSNPVAIPASKNAGSNEMYLQSILVNSGINDPIKLAAWMSQCKVESDGFRALREYASGAEYEGRRDLGNIQEGDGVRYKGRGFIQLTGRDVYKKMTKFFNAGIDFETQPELIESIEWAAKSVLYFFNEYKKGRTAKVNWDDCLAVTKIVNGGTNGLAKRQQYYNEYKTKFQTDGVVPQGTVGTGSNSVLTDGYGNPIKTGQ